MIPVITNSITERLLLKKKNLKLKNNKISETIDFGTDSDIAILKVLCTRKFQGAKLNISYDELLILKSVEQLWKFFFCLVHFYANLVKT